ncbi:Bifunctional purine biosynthesis protein PurH [Coemansia sp. RSA 1813]|nr:Bifunctional purine biosynthesis protein PurH [Coemansia sp. RSA 1646]KAJ1768155.1 Bifunctional purine biosynthesis protein PurH [Coemansia sp. RSA 1843]KAJ2093373.1 Bifunctional purine biosynthesis protein PurH [Coemansia sp. RSA 986]KAJ2217182.1 Bifunctional purine biosynthesis protein PurH [Coemansia sp. RSA 487]KAJ2572380.1 Bifunctional purine biosynthesis protein PurH [Coemansia sp. RSA 1813]
MSSDIKTSSIHLGITKYQLFCVIAASIPSINFGWNFVVTNLPGDIIIKCLAGPKHNIGGLPSCIPATEFVWGVAVGSYAIGALIGAIGCTRFSNMYGRKFVLLYSNIIGLISALLLAFSVNIPMFVCARVIAGISQGAANGTFSTYVVEIATPRARNSLACVIQLAVSLGVMLGLVCSLGMLKPPLWRVLFSLTGVLCLLSMALIYFCVESPKWLEMKNKHEQAQTALLKLRKNADITEEYEQIVMAVQPDGSKSTQDSYTASVLDVILGKTPDNLYHQVLVSAMGMVFQQASGISGISFFSTTLFNSISAPPNTSDVSKPTFAQFLSVVVSFVGVACTLIGMILASYMGRRAMMFLSHGLMAVFCVLLSIGDIYNMPFLAISSVFIFYGVYYFGSGPLSWAIPNEITPTYAISAVMAITNSVGYLGIFAIGLIFSPLISVLHGYSFLVFAAANLIAVVFFFFFLPETKDRTTVDLVRVHSVGVHIVLRPQYKIPIYDDTCKDWE